MSHDKIWATFVKFWQQLRPQSTIHDLNSLGLRPRSPNCPRQWRKSRTFWAITRTGTSLGIGCVQFPEPGPVLAQVLFDFMNWDWSGPWSCSMSCTKTSLSPSPIWFSGPKWVLAPIPFAVQNQDMSQPCFLLILRLVSVKFNVQNWDRSCYNWYLFNLSRYQIPQIGKIGLIDNCRLF